MTPKPVVAAATRSSTSRRTFPSRSGRLAVLAVRRSGSFASRSEAASQRTGSVEARLTNEPGKPVVVRPKTVRMTVTAPSPTISTVGSAETVPLEDLPTEVISEAIEAGITLLPPDPDDVDGQWVAEVDTGGYHVPLGVGQLPDILLVAAEWLEGLAERVQERRKDEGA